MNSLIFYATFTHKFNALRKECLKMASSEILHKKHSANTNQDDKNPPS